MEAKETNFLRFLNSPKQLVIPIYQRTKLLRGGFRWFITPKGEEYLKKEEKNEI